MSIYSKVDFKSITANFILKYFLTMTFYGIHDQRRITLKSMIEVTVGSCLACTAAHSAKTKIFIFFNTGKLTKTWCPPLK